MGLLKHRKSIDEAIDTSSAELRRSMSGIPQKLSKSASSATAGAAAIASDGVAHLRRSLSLGSGPGRAAAFTAASLAVTTAADVLVSKQQMPREDSNEDQGYALTKTTAQDFLETPRMLTPRGCREDADAERRAELGVDVLKNLAPAQENQIPPVTE